MSHFSNCGVLFELWGHLFEKKGGGFTFSNGVPLLEPLGEGGTLTESGNSVGRLQKSADAEPSASQARQRRRDAVDRAQIREERDLCARVCRPPPPFALHLLLCCSCLFRCCCYCSLQRLFPVSSASVCTSPPAPLLLFLPLLLLRCCTASPNVVVV